MQGEVIMQEMAERLSTQSHNSLTQFMPFQALKKILLRTKEHDSCLAFQLCFGIVATSWRS